MTDLTHELDSGRVHPDRARIYAQTTDGNTWAALYGAGGDEHVTLEILAFPLAAVFAGWKDGDEIGWPGEFARLHEIHADHLRDLRGSIAVDGIKTAIDLGHDGRVWNGHHRLCIANELGLTHVPVRFLIP